MSSELGSRPISTSSRLPHGKGRRKSVQSKRAAPVSVGSLQIVQRTDSKSDVTVAASRATRRNSVRHDEAYKRKGNFSQNSIKSFEPLTINAKTDFLDQKGRKTKSDNNTTDQKPDIAGWKAVRTGDLGIGEENKRSVGYVRSPRQRKLLGRLFSNSIQEEEENEESVDFNYQDNFLDYNYDSHDDETRAESAGPLRGSTLTDSRSNTVVITDLECCSIPFKDEDLVTSDDDKVGLSSSDSDSLYDTDLEEETVGLRCPFIQTGKEIYEMICKKKGIVPVSYLLSRFGESEIVMPHHGLGPEGGDAVAKALVVDTCIERIDLSDNDLQEKGGMSLAFMLYENSYITDLDLSENSIGTRGGIQLAKVLLKNRGLRRLVLRGNQFSDKVAIPFAEALTENRTLNVLDLSYNELGEMGGLYLGAGLSMNYGLKMLNLKWNAIVGKGAVAIAHALSAHETLTSLNVSWNSFGYTGALALSTNLRKNESLKHLDLRNNHLNGDAAKKLASSIATHKNLVEIKFGQNPISMAGVEAVFEAVIANPRILHVGMEDISVPQELIPRIEKLEKERRTVVITDKKTRVSTAEKEKPGMDILMDYLQQNSLRLKDVFFRLDKDHSGDITREELQKGLKEMGILLDSKQLTNLINEIDEDASDTIDFKEIIAGHRSAVLEKRSQTIIKLNLKKKHEAALILPEMELIKKRLPSKESLR